MDPRPSFGSGSPMVGGSLVANQMQSGVPGMGQQGPQSPGFIPQMQANPLPGTMPQTTGIPNSILPSPQMQTQTPQLQKPANQPPKSEAELIIEALTNHLGKIAAQRQHILDSQMPKPTLPAPGGGRSE